MKNLTKKEIRNALKQEDYMTALAFFAEQLAEVEEEDLDDAIDDLDNVVWPVACEDIEYQDMWLQIYSGLKLAA